MDVEGVLPGGIISLTRGMDHYENTGEGLDMGSILGMRWPETEKDFEALKRKVAVNPMGPGRFVSYDGTAVMISAPLVDGNEEALMGSLPSGVEASKHVVVKVLNLLNETLPKGSMEFKTAVKERCSLLLKQAEAYEEGGVAVPFVQGLAQKSSALLLGV